MEKINFTNNTVPALNATNLNKLQDNVEDAIEELETSQNAKIKTTETTSDTDTYSCNYINEIVESGSNANGNYIKYIDGTMICTMNIVFTGASINETWGSLYVYDNRTVYNFPQTFIAPPVVQKTISLTSSSGAILFDYGDSEVTSTSFKGWSLTRPTTHTCSGSLYITAIGKWK